MSAFYVEHVAMSKFCVTVWQCPDGRISLNFFDEYQALVELNDRYHDYNKLWDASLICISI